MSAAAPADSLWETVFKCLALYLRSPARGQPKRLLADYEAIVRLDESDEEAGTLTAAVWMARAIVRMAYNHGLVDLEDIPPAVSKMAGVSPEDRVPPPTPPAPPATPEKRPRTPTKLPNASTLGGPVDKTTKDDLEDTKTDDEEDEVESDDEETQDDVPAPPAKTPRTTKTRGQRKGHYPSPASHGASSREKEGELLAGDGRMVVRPCAVQLVISKGANASVVRSGRDKVCRMQVVRNWNLGKRCSLPNRHLLV